WWQHLDRPRGHQEKPLTQQQGQVSKEMLIQVGSNSDLVNLLAAAHGLGDDLKARRTLLWTRQPSSPGGRSHPQQPARRQQQQRRLAVVHGADMAGEAVTLNPRDGHGTALERTASGRSQLPSHMVVGTLPCTHTRNERRTRRQRRSGGGLNLSFRLNNEAYEEQPQEETTMEEEHTELPQDRDMEATDNPRYPSSTPTGHPHTPQQA
ncbi:hypothetical protein V8C86DRAFT_2447197, partial [Haematococcus lacustris]